MLRPATPDDIPFIQSILNAPGNLGKLEGYADDVLHDSLRDADVQVFIWMDQGAAVGFCWLRRGGDGTKIEEFGVSHPGGGVGSAFFAAVLDHVTAQAPGALIWLRVAGDNASAIRFYERFGFQRTGVAKAAWARRAGPVADAVRMERRGA